ncbi:MAG TPA: hypothetical protein VN457_03095 [Chlamydiales bacterium]|nr:hypothetical protein [Chlamydiales bacterium]
MQSQGGFIAPSASSKITPLSQPGFTKPEPLQAPDNDAEDESSASTANSFFSVLMPLVTLLGGTFFLFFALMLKLFSKNGKLTLEWSADSWPYFLFPALFLLLLGLGTITSEEPESI